MADLITLADTERTRMTIRHGSHTVSILPPGKLKIQTTAGGAATLLEQGPAEGKVWTALVAVQIEETDA